MEGETGEVSGADLEAVVTVVVVVVVVAPVVVAARTTRVTGCP